MTITLTFGWWLLPAIVTLVSFGWSLLKEVSSTSPANGYAAAAGAVISLLSFLASAVVSLAAWLIWSLLT